MLNSLDKEGAENARLIFCLRLFYALSLLVFMRLSYRSSLVLQVSQLLVDSPVNWSLIFRCSTTLGFVVAIFCIVFVKVQTFRGIHFLCLAMSVFVLVKLKLVGQNYHAWIWCSLVLSFVNGFSQNSKLLGSSCFRYETWGKLRVPQFLGLGMGSSKPGRWQVKNALWVFSVAQLFFASFYFSAGIWKLYHILECWVDTDLVCQFDAQLFQRLMAREMIKYPQVAPLWELLFDRPILGTLGYFSVCLFQLSSLFFWYQSRHHRLYGVLAILFHCLNASVLGVDFGVMAVALIPVFVFSPFSSDSASLELVASRRSRLLTGLSCFGISMFISHLLVIWETLGTSVFIDTLMCICVLVSILGLLSLWRNLLVVMGLVGALITLLLWY